MPLECFLAFQGASFIHVVCSWVSTFYANPFHPHRTTLKIDDSTWESISFVGAYASGFILHAIIPVFQELFIFLVFSKCPF